MIDSTKSATEPQQGSKNSEEEALRHLIGNAAHDLKTPLASFMSGTDAIEKILSNLEETLDERTSDLESSDDAFSGDVKDSIVNIRAVLQDICNTNQFMMMSINRCIDYTKSTDGLKLQPHRECFDWIAAVKLPVLVMRNTQDSCTIYMNPPSKEICSCVLTDKQWFQENILCLLSNAVKYSGKGDVVVTASLETIAGADDASPATTYLRVEVQDSGIGVPEEMRDRLFHPFRQTQKLAGGTGLGLYSLAKRLEALNGRYGVEGRRDGAKGSIFYFAVPYRPDWDTHNELIAQASNTAKMTRGYSEIMRPFPMSSSSKLSSFSSSSSSFILPGRPSSTKSAFSISGGCKVVEETGADQDASTTDSRLEDCDEDNFVDAEDEAHNSKAPTPVASFNGSSTLQNHASMSESLRKMMLDIPKLEIREGRRSVSEAAASFPSEFSSGHNSARLGDDQHDIFARSPSTVGAPINLDRRRSSGSHRAVGAQMSPTTPTLPQPLQVFLVEDSLTIAKTTIALLKRNGMEVDHAANGMLATERICVAEGRPHYDVVLMDLSMPIMDGLTATQRIREFEASNPNPSCPRLLIIGLSANSDQETLLATANAGFDAFIDKPLKADVLLSMLGRSPRSTTSTGAVANSFESGSSIGNGRLSCSAGSPRFAIFSAERFRSYSSQNGSPGYGPSSSSPSSSVSTPNQMAQAALLQASPQKVTNETETTIQPLVTMLEVAERSAALSESPSATAPHGPLAMLMRNSSGSPVSLSPPVQGPSLLSTLLRSSAPPSPVPVRGATGFEDTSHHARDKQT